MDLTDSERETLHAMRAITINGDGDEVFVGLDAAESVEFLALSRQSEAGQLASDHPRHRELYAKHEPERQAIIDGKRQLE